MKRRGTREFVGLLVLFAILVGLAVFYEQVGQERVAANSPTTMNTQHDGVRALLLLLLREGIRADLLKSPWSNLGSGDGLLIFVEPADSDRPVSPGEMKSLEAWIRAGGTLLDLVSDPPVDQPLSPTNTITGDAGATGGSDAEHEVSVLRDSGSERLAGVNSLQVRSAVRIFLARDAPYIVLARDVAGIIAVEKPLGKGHVVLIADKYAATNAGLAQADNALFLVNIARQTAALTGKTVRFDEYHHGVGFADSETAAQPDVWKLIPLPWRFAIVYCCAVAVVLLYNGNRRFGPALTSVPPSTRASTDYVNSLARLYRRAGASDLAFEALYVRFMRDLRRALDVPADAGTPFVARAAQQKYGLAASGIHELMIRGDGILAGQRVTESDMLNLAQRIEQFRRATQLVGV